MHEMFYFVTGFGLLAFLEKPSRRVALRGRDVLKTFLLRGWALFAAAGVLVSAYALIFEIRFFCGQGDWAAVLFFFPAAFAAGRALRRPPFFSLTVFGLSFAAVEAGPLYPLWVRFAWIAAAAFGWTLFQLLFLGLSERLRFSLLPAAVRGLPVLLATAALLVLALSGFRFF